MKKAKLKKVEEKTEKVVESSTFSTKTKVITAIILLLFLVGFYVLTIFLVKDRKEEKKEEPKIVNVREEYDINYSDIKDIKESKYYLLVNKKDDENNNSYDSFINSVKYNNLGEEFYYIDLGKDENKSLLTDKEDLKDLSKLKVKDTTLLYIEDGKIKESFVGKEKILGKLQSFFFVVSDSSNSNSNKDDNKSNSNSNKDDKKSNSNSNKDDKKSNSNSNKDDKKSNSNKK